MVAENELKEFGLSDNEVKVYLSSLMLGASTANKIAEKAGLLRTTTYEVLKMLVAKGLASYVIKKRTKYFEVVDPKILVELLEEKKKRLSKVLPSLMQLKESVVEKPVVEIYEGKEGLKTILEDLIKNAGKRYSVIGNNQKFRAVLFDYYVESFIKKRLKSKISCKFILEPGKETDELKRHDRKVKRNTKIMEELKEASAELFIYNDKIALFTLIRERPIGIVIKEKSVSYLCNVMFDKIWKTSKK